jgi:hypothetical protein
MVGKVRLALAPPLNHWWHVPLYVTVRGLTTSMMPLDGGAVELEFELQSDRLMLKTSDGQARELELRPMSVASFYAEFRALLREAGIDVRINPVPVEVEDAIPFADDTAPGDYVPAHARALHGALIDADRVLSRFRSGFVGKMSPVHFFWGAFDLAASRFNGLPARRWAGNVANCPTWVMEQAYSHEVSSAGWWPGPPELGAAFYAYHYPEPAGYNAASIAPVPGRYDPQLGEFVLPQRVAAATDDPDATVLAFLAATYGAGADLAGWDRQALEPDRGPA